MFENIAAYHFVDIAEPAALAVSLRERAECAALRGTILVAAEGINLFLAGAFAAINTYVDELRADPLFASIVIKRSTSATQPFARLKVKVKREIISFRQDGASPLQGRARALAPIDLARWIAQGHDDDGRRLALLDARNADEVAHGSFVGAVTLPITRFGDFPRAVDAVRDDLADATVVSFCTGGIRCEKAALWMHANGFDYVWQLDGGILGYFDQVGAFGFDGRCFVFDARVALDSGLMALTDVTR